MAKTINDKSEMINDEKTVGIDENLISIKSQVLIEIFNILHSCKVDEDAVDKIAFVKQTIKQILSMSKVG